MSLSTPQEIMERLDAIDQDLADRQNLLEGAAMEWFKAKREREKQRAERFLTTSGVTVAERNAYADKATALIGAEHEAEYEALKAVIRVLETRVSIGQSLLKAQGRAT